MSTRPKGTDPAQNYVQSLERYLAKVEDERDAQRTRNAALEADYHRIIREIIPHAKPASSREDDQLEPPWEVVSRIMAQNAVLVAEVERLSKTRFCQFCGRLEGER